MSGWTAKVGGLPIFTVFSGHLEGWTARDEAPLEAVVICTKDTPYPCAIACDAKMEPEVVVRGSGSVNEA